MNTPIYDFVRAYAQSGISRLHMPGHKGAPLLGCEGLDITEIAGADALYECEGIIAQSEANATALFGTGRTLYTTEGSSHVIRSMVTLAWQHRKPGREHILAVRNVHRSFLYACALVGCAVDWLYPQSGSDNSICSCQVDPEVVEAALAEGKPPFALYLTSPDYLGHTADIAGIARVCKKYDVPLLVDNAHGAYLHFLDKPAHPMDLGAWLCADSAHKTLPVLTGGAYLHMSHDAAQAWGQEAKGALVMTGSTSPSYLTLQSLDLCNRYLSEAFSGKLGACCARLDALKAHLTAHGMAFVGDEGLKLTLDAAGFGYSGEELGQILRQNAMEPEFTDSDYLVCMFAPNGSWEEDMDRLEETLLALLPRPSRPRQVLQLRPLERRMSIRRAVFARHEWVRLDRAAGRICGQPTVSCPPAVPIAISGEVITEDILPLFAAYGQREIAVVAREEENCCE